MQSVLSIIERGNQRGGRMLSVIDLLNAGTLTAEQAAWLLDRIIDGSSWLVGAKPGGGGKTTVMSALLAMLPADTKIRLASQHTFTSEGWKSGRPGECVVAYEIGSGFYEAYVWGEELRNFCRLGTTGCRIITNLHADSLEEAFTQVVTENGVLEQWFNKFDMFLPISISNFRGNPKRVIESIQYFDKNHWAVCGRNPEVSGRQIRIIDFLEKCAMRSIVNIADVRKAWLTFLQGSA
jgi:hypothetical protein